MNKRFIVYPALLLSGILATSVISYDFSQSACLRTMDIDQPWGRSVLSPDGRFVATAGAKGGITVTRVDRSTPETLLTDAFAPADERGDHPKLPFGFSGQSAHLIMHDEVRFRVIDLETRQSVDYSLPPGTLSGAANTEEPAAAAPASETELVPIDQGTGKPVPPQLYTEAPTRAQSGAIAAAQLSATARYVVLSFSTVGRIALLERSGTTYAFRRWFELSAQGVTLVHFAGDDSMFLLQNHGELRAFALPTGHTIKAESLEQWPLRDSCISAHPTRPLFSFVEIQTNTIGGFSRCGWYDPAAKSVVGEDLSRGSLISCSHSTPDGSRGLYPIVGNDQILASLALFEKDGGTHEFNLRRGRQFHAGEERRYLDSGLGPEGRLLRIASQRGNQTGFAIDTYDLDRLWGMTETVRRERAGRSKLQCLGGLLLLCTVFEGTLSLGRRRERARDQQRQRFLAACTAGDEEAVSNLCRGRRASALANLRDERQRTPLQLAAANGNPAIVTILLAHGAEIDAVEPSVNGTPLLLACSAPKGEATARLLIQKGANLRAIGKGGIRAAKLAAERGWTEILAAIAAQAPDTLAMPTDDGVTPAYAAAEGNHIDCLELCANHAPSSLAHCRKEDRASPAYVAAFHGHVAALEVIAHTSIDALRIPGPNGYLPTAIAAQKGRTACVQLFARHVPDTFSVTVEGERRITPAFLAAQNGHHETLEAIASVAPATLGQPCAGTNVTPAYQAAFKGHHRCLEIIGRHAPESLRLRNAEDHLPVFVAAQNDHVAALEAIHRFAPETFSDPRGGTPAFIAAQLDAVAALRCILRLAPESCDVLVDGSNPAHVAAVLLKEEGYGLLAAERPGLLSVANSAEKTPPQLLEEAREEYKAKEEQERKARAAAKTTAGLVLWGIGFTPDAQMLYAAIMAFAQGNIIRATLLHALPSELMRLDSKPSEAEALLCYGVVARLKGWSGGPAPKFQFLGLPDGRQFILAYPSNR